MKNFTTIFNIRNNNFFHVTRVVAWCYYVLKLSVWSYTVYNYLLAGQCTLRVLAAGQLITQHHNPCADRLNGWMRIVTTPRRISSLFERCWGRHAHCRTNNPLWYKLIQFCICSWLTFVLFRWNTFTVLRILNIWNALWCFVLFCDVLMLKPWREVNVLFIAASHISSDTGC